MEGSDPKELLFCCALQNAVKHGGVPQAGAVIGMVMGAHPELRSRAQDIGARTGSDRGCRSTFCR